MKKLVLTQFLLFFTLSSLFSQNKFWEIAGKFPILEQGETKNMVLRGFDWVEVKDSFFVTITDVAVNSKNIMLGRIDRDLSRGLYKSVDGGKKWDKVIPKIPLLSDPQLREGLFATEAAYQNALEKSRYIIQSLFAFGEDFYMINGDGQFAGTFLLRSKDLGKTWEEMSTLSVYSSITPNTNYLVKWESYANSTFMGSNTLHYSISQDSGRTWNQIFKDKDLIGHVYTGQDFSIDPKISGNFYKYISEDTWYNEDLFNSRKNKPNENVYKTSVKRIFKGGDKGLAFTLIYPEKTTLSFAPDLPEGEAHPCQSTDGGKTWKIVSKVTPGKHRGIYYVDCNDVIYASLISPVEGFCRSTNGGKTWEQLQGLPVNPIIGTISLTPDGSFYYVDKKHFYRSKEKVCIPSSSEPDPCSTVVNKNNYYVKVSPTSQPTISTCWAACAAMMYSWKYNQPQITIEKTIEQIEGKTSGNDNSYLNRFKKSKANGNNDLSGGLKYETYIWSKLDEPSHFFIELMKLSFHNGDILELDFEKCLPILAVRCHKQNNNTCESKDYMHGIIIVGVSGDGTPECTKFRVIDPWHRNDSGVLKDGPLKETELSYAELTSCCQAYAFYEKQDTYAEVKTTEIAAQDMETADARTAVYFCSETGYYGYCYGVDDVESCAKKNCIRAGGRNPQQVGGVVRNKGYGAIAIAKSTNGKPTIGTAAGCSSQAEADQMAVKLCKQHGGQNPRVDARFLDDSPENVGVQETSGNQWTLISKSNNTKKLYNEKDKLWAIGLNNGVYSFDGQNWTVYPGGGQAIDIAANNGIPYVIGTDSYIYKGTGSGWVKLDNIGTGKSIFCDKGTIWVIGSDDAIYSFKNNKWSTYPGNGLGFDIAANNGVPYVVGLDNIIYKGNGSGWTPLSGQKGKRIFCESGKVWIIGIDDNIYKHDGSKWVLYPGNGKGIDISVINGVPYVVGLDNAIYKGK